MMKLDCAWAYFSFISDFEQNLVNILRISVASIKDAKSHAYWFEERLMTQDFPKIWPEL